MSLRRGNAALLAAAAALARRSAGLAAVPAMALAVLALSVHPGQAAAQPEDPPEKAGTYRLKPGARGTACLGCHEDFAATLKLPFLHTPVRQGDCTRCHNPHAAAHGKLLAEEPSEICAKCHADILPEGARSVHEAVAKGDCVSCHDPHGASTKGLLKQGGNELCYRCHADVEKAVAAASFRHPPVGKGCLGCHSPHASQGADHLLRQEAPALCVGCHKTETASFTARHFGYSVGKSDCTSCHDPHGSSTRGMLWANVHGPVATEACGQCHTGGASGSVALKRTGTDLCMTCHKDVVEEALSRPHTHSPVHEGKGCLNCHDPHAAPGKHLVRGDQNQICGACHADTIAREAVSLVKHQPVVKGECSECHAPHGGDNALLFTSPDVNDMCGKCHDWLRHTSHPIGPDFKDPRNKNVALDCMSCHRNHGSAFKGFLHGDPKGELCVQCHSQHRR